MVLCHELIKLSAPKGGQLPSSANCGHNLGAVFARDREPAPTGALQSPNVNRRSISYDRFQVPERTSSHPRVRPAPVVGLRRSSPFRSTKSKGVRSAVRRWPASAAHRVGQHIRTEHHRLAVNREAVGLAHNDGSDGLEQVERVVVQCR